MRYSLDTSALIEAWVRNYPPDVFPAFWSRLEDLIRSGDVAASDEVLHELEARDDDLFAWAKKQPCVFRSLDSVTQAAVSEVLDRYEHLVDTRGGSAADPFVIGFARVHGLTVVTMEKRTGNMDKPHIPDVCEGFGVRCINLLGFIREMNWVF